MDTKVQQILKSHSVNRTKIREQVLLVFLNEDRALSSKEIETALIQKMDTVDRITLYRTLKTFETKGIIHSAIDGTNTSKYAICNTTCTEHNHVDNHAHFNCTDCGKTICLEELETPVLKSAQGLRINSTHLILKGNCGECQ